MKRLLLAAAVCMSLPLFACEDAETTAYHDAYMNYVGRLQECGVMNSGRVSTMKIDYYTYNQSDRQKESQICYYNCLAKIDCTYLWRADCEKNSFALEMVVEATNACYAHCTPTFTCKDGKKISLFLQCDGNKGCPDGSDEVGCPEREKFQCDDGKYVWADRVCDYAYDCEDGSDEDGCLDYPTFRCDDGARIAAKYECDGTPQCLDESDELNCSVAVCTKTTVL